MEHVLRSTWQSYYFIVLFVLYETYDALFALIRGQVFRLELSFLQLLQQ